MHCSQQHHDRAAAQGVTLRTHQEMTAQQDAGQMLAELPFVLMYLGDILVFSKSVRACTCARLHSPPLISINVPVTAGTVPAGAAPGTSWSRTGCTGCASSRTRWSIEACTTQYTGIGTHALILRQRSIHRKCVACTSDALGSTREPEARSPSLSAPSAVVGGALPAGRACVRLGTGSAPPTTALGALSEGDRASISRVAPNASLVHATLPAYGSLTQDESVRANASVLSGAGLNGPAGPGAGATGHTNGCANAPGAAPCWRGLFQLSQGR